MRIPNWSVPFFIGLIISFLVWPADAQQTKSDPKTYGRYFCYVKNAAGLQYVDGKFFHSGPVRFPENRQKFILTLSPIKRSELTGEFCEKSVQHFIAKLKSGKSYEDDDNEPATVARREFLGYECFTKDEIVIKYSGIDFTPRMRSYEQQFEFFGLVNGQWFSLYDDKSFRRGETFDGGNRIVSDGQCEKID